MNYGGEGSSGDGGGGGGGGGDGVGEGGSSPPPSCSVFNGGGGGGGGSSSSPSTGFENLQRPRWSRRNRKRPRRRGDSNEKKEDKIPRFRLRMKNLYRAYSNVMNLVFDHITKAAEKKKNGITCTCDKGMFTIRVLGSVDGTKAEDQRPVDEQTKLQKKGKVAKKSWSRYGEGSSKNNKIKEKKMTKTVKEEENDEADEGKQKTVGGEHYVDLVFRHRDIYLLGFVYKGKYYKRKNDEEDDTTIPDGVMEVVPLPFGGSYKDLGVSFHSDIAVGTQALVQMFKSLTRIEELRDAGRLDLIMSSLATAVVVFCEALRFPKLQKFISNSLKFWLYSTNLIIPREEANKHFHNWEKYSAQILNDKFIPKGIFKELSDLEAFVGILLRAAEVKS